MYAKYIKRILDFVLSLMALINIGQGDSSITIEVNERNLDYTRVSLI